MIKALTALAALLALTFAGSAASHGSAGYTCSGSIVEVFKGFGTGAARNGATAPSFSTGGHAYCLTAIQTYHWNGGKGQTPGTLGLKHVSGPAGFASVGPFKAVGSAGQNNAPNVNWQANVPTAPNPTAIDGTYTCTDSDPATWSADTAGGPGYCNVYGILAQGGPAPAPTTTAATPPAVKASAKEVVEPDGRIELVVKDLGTTPIMSVRFRPFNWAILKLGAVRQQGICTIDGTDEMVCDKNFSIDPGKSIQFTITDSVGPNDGGYVLLGDSQLHIVVDGPEGSPPATPPPATPASRAKEAVYLIDYAITKEQEALTYNNDGKFEAAGDRLSFSRMALRLAHKQILGITDLTDADASIFHAEIFDEFWGRDSVKIEDALHGKTLALAEIRAFLAKK